MVHTQKPAVVPKGGRDNTVTGWVGWVLFAGIVMLAGGFLNMIEGFVALVRDEYYLVRASGLVVSLDYTAWGWTLLLFGVLLGAAGYGVMVGQMWARVTGVILAVVNALLNMMFMPAYPFWAVMVITLDVLIIYALVVHGGEARRVNPR